MCVSNEINDIHSNRNTQKKRTKENNKLTTNATDQTHEGNEEKKILKIRATVGKSYRNKSSNKGVAPTA